MKRFLPIIWALALSLGHLRAEDGADLFFALASACALQPGALKVVPYKNSLLWLNGVRQDTKSGTDPLLFKPGDVWITSSANTAGWEPQPLADHAFLRYRLDKLTAQRAYFTLSIFNAVVESLNGETRRYRMGTLRSSRTFELDVTRELFYLGACTDGINRVQVGTVKSNRTK